MDRTDKLSIGKKLGMDVLKEFAYLYGRERVNFQDILDEMNTENFITDLKDPAISFKENKERNNMKKDKADRLRNEHG